MGIIVAVIRMQTYEPEVITTEEYEQVKRDVEARIIAGAAGVGDRILARLLTEHYGRYCEAKAQNEAREGR